MEICLKQNFSPVPSNSVFRGFTVLYDLSLYLEHIHPMALPYLIDHSPLSTHYIYFFHNHNELWNVFFISLNICKMDWIYLSSEMWNHPTLKQKLSSNLLCWVQAIESLPSYPSSGFECNAPASHILLSFSKS